MIRVLNVISGLNNAGTEAVVMNYYRNIDREKVQFDFLVLNTDKGYYEEEILSMGGKVFKIPSFRQSPFRCMKARKKFFKTHHYDIVEVHSPSTLRYAYCKLAKKSGAKVIFHIHSSSNQNNGLIKYARKQIEKYCDETVTCSQTAAVSILGKEADKIVYNAIDYDKYKFDEASRRKIRQFYDIMDNQKVVGHVGRFSWQKNPIFLLEMFSQAAMQDSALVLMMKGFGELENDIRNKIKELKLEARVILCGKEFAAEELYNAFDVFILPSKLEGLGIVAIEAQANRLIVLCSINVPKEADISYCTKFIVLSKSAWEQELLNKENYKRIPESFDFLKTGYDIKSAAAKRQNEYLEMALGQQK